MLLLLQRKCNLQPRWWWGQQWWQRRGVLRMSYAIHGPIHPIHQAALVCSVHAGTNTVFNNSIWRRNQSRLIPQIAAGRLCLRLGTDG
jgi:hypothetical protein